MNKVTPALPSEEEQYCQIFDAATDGIIIVSQRTGQILKANPAICKMQGYSCSEFVGMFPETFIHPDSQHTFNNFLRAFQSGASFDTYVLHKRNNGSTFQAEWHATIFPYQDQVCVLGVVRDISQRIRSQEQLHEQVEARTHEQTTLLEISHALASTLELQPGLILEQLREIIEYTHAGLFGLTDSTLNALAVRVGPTDSKGAPRVQPGRSPKNSISKGSEPHKLELSTPFQIRLDGPETLKTLFNGHRPIRISDVTSADPQAKFLHSLLNGNAGALLKGVRAWMWVPLAVKGRIIGGFGIAHTRRNFFTPHHAALALAMADQVAITMVNAELFENAGALAALQERQRLAQNLHDAVNQSLFSAGLIAEVLPRLWERDPDEARHSLEDLRRLTRGALAEMRELLTELRPSVLTDSNLGDLLRQLANAFTGRSNIPVHLKINGEHILPSEIQVAVYRICQEAFNNIAKHAEASHVDIDLQYNLDPGTNAVRSIELLIHDDGHGFDPGGPSAPGHYGLGMMHERAETVDAYLTVTSQLGQGTEIRLSWPDKPRQEVP
jgi:PAS domain S-box-containing protein